MNKIYLIDTAHRRFIIQAESAEKALQIVRETITHKCPWTQKINFVEPGLTPLKCLRLTIKPTKSPASDTQTF